jgi:hypothetical protein
MRTNRRPSNARGLTLMEMMAVVFIIILILGISLPAFIGINKAQGVSQAGRMVSNLMYVARADAIANGRRVRVVFAGSNAGIASSSEDFPKVYRAYSLVAKTVGTLSDSNRDSWSYIDDWYYLPTGIVFPSGSLSNLQTFNCSMTLSAGYGVLNYVEFKPSGRASGAASGTLSILQGAVQGSGTTTTTTVAPLPNKADITWDIYTGRIKVVRPGE